jgi:hypothetical protein
MPKTKISQYDSTSAGANLNTDIAGINIDEGCAPSGINNAIRTLMAQIRDLQSGVSGDSIPVTAGGTGSTTASGARTNLSAAASGANSDITSITGLTTPLTVAQGGTGSTTASGARTNLSAAASGANSDITSLAGITAGTAASPTITTVGDTNTGMFFPAADTIAFAEGGVEAMRLDSSGNVGIGTTTPAAKLQVAGTAFFGATGTGAVGIITPDPTSGANGVNLAASFASGGYGPLTFSTNATERMRIESSGVVLIGSASVFSGANSKLSALWDPSSQNGFTLKASGTTFSNYAIAFRTSTDTTSGYISQTASTVTYSTSSDYRLKENIEPMTGALNKVALLKPVTYTWKIDNSAGQGFIAHELQEVVPEAVCGEKDAVDEDGSIKPQGIDTSFLVATLTAAIQEQQTIINDLTARITVLEAK